MKASDRRHRISNTTDRREEKGEPTLVASARCPSKVAQQGVRCFSKGQGVPCFSKASRTTTARHSGRFLIVRNRLRHYASPQIRPCYIVRDRVRRPKSGRPKNPLLNQDLRAAQPSRRSIDLFSGLTLRRTCVLYRQQCPMCVHVTCVLPRAGTERSCLGSREVGRRRRVSSIT